MVRSILGSLACKYRLVLEQLLLVIGRQMRELVADATPMARYEPSATQSSDETYDRFLAVTGLRSQRPAHAEV